jgi:RNA polymerase sigma-70 factor (ECF subfamily)
VSGQRAASQGADLLDLYDEALPRVYGYLLARCQSRAIAEDLTSETFLAAADALGRVNPPALSTAWLVGVARHKLVDHWRRTGREQRGLQAIEGSETEADDPWDVHLDLVRAQNVLEQLGPHHRAALTLRYLDDLAVSEVAQLLDRTLHGTEGLLSRARAAFKRAYLAGEEDDA